VRRFVFLDRDGTLVRDEGYTHRVEDYELLPGVVEGLRRLVEAGYALAIVTNQSGIGRGYFDEAAYDAFRRHLEHDLASHGVPIERSYHCPHLPDAGCGCRKPAPGMLLRARDELGADLGESWVVGDRPHDVEMAARAGCAGGVLIDPGGGPGTVPDLPTAAERILAPGQGRMAR
jgi:D-glycero-D-manno-heptose 1,7-bisphosphate phosphatase